MAIALLVSSTVALAAPTDTAAAEALFAEGRRLMEAGEIAAACAKFEASYGHEAALGTLLNLAQCRAREGKTATAWGHAHTVRATASRTGDAKRERAAQALLAELEPKLARLVVTVRSPVGGLVVERDGKALAEGEWGVPIPVDPGAHRVQASAPGHLSVVVTAEVAQPAATITVEVPALVRAVAATTSPPPRPPTSEPRNEPRAGAQRWAGIAAVGTGVAALAVGTTFGALAKGSWDDARAHCDASNACDPDGLTAASRAEGQARISTVLFAAGGAVLVGGIVLWLTAPSTARAGRGAGVLRF